MLSPYLRRRLRSLAEALRDTAEDRCRSGDAGSPGPGAAPHASPRPLSQSQDLPEAAPGEASGPRRKSR